MPTPTQAEAQGPGDPRIYAVANENGEFRVERKSSLPSADYLFYASCVSDIAEVAIGPPYSEALIGTGGPFAGRPVHAEADREVDLGEVSPIHYRAVSARVVTREGKPMLGAQERDRALCLSVRLRDERGDVIAQEGLSRAAIDPSNSSISLAVPEGKWTPELVDICKRLEYAAAGNLMTITAVQAEPVNVALTPGHDQRGNNRISYTRAQAVAELEREGMPFTKESLAERAERGNTTGVELLLVAGMTANVKTRDGSPALMAALRGGHRAIVRDLIESGADVDCKESNGATPVMLAAFVGDGVSLRRLIRAGADVNLKTDQGFTALMAAAESGHLGAVKLLISAGADPKLRDVEAKTAADYAIRNPAILDLLKR